MRSYIYPICIFIDLTLFLFCRYDPETDKLNPSVTVFRKSDLNILGEMRLVIDFDDINVKISM